MSTKQTLLLETFLSMGLNCCSYDKNNDKHHLSLILARHCAQWATCISCLSKLPFHSSDTLIVRRSHSVHASSLSAHQKIDIAEIQTIGRDISTTFGLSVANTEEL